MSGIHTLAISFERLPGSFECRGKCGQLLACAFTIALVKSLVHSWNHDRCVTRVFARGVNRVAEPGTMRYSLRLKHGTFGSQQGLIQLRHIARRILLLRQDLRARGLEMSCGCIHSIEVERSFAELVVCAPVRG